MSAITKDRLNVQIISYVNMTLERGPGHAVHVGFVDGRTLIDNGTSYINLLTDKTDEFIDELNRLKSVAQSSACMDPDRALENQIAVLNGILEALGA